MGRATRSCREPGGFGPLRYDPASRAWGARGPSTSEGSSEMAHDKGDAEKRTLNPRADQSPEELEREARHQEPFTERRDVTDRDVGEDRIQQKGIGGYGADESSVDERARRGEPPLTDKS
jgi:hypothetical protein